METAQTKAPSPRRDDFHHGASPTIKPMTHGTPLIAEGRGDCKPRREPSSNGVSTGTHSDTIIDGKKLECEIGTSLYWTDAQH